MLSNTDLTMDFLDAMFGEEGRDGFRIRLYEKNYIVQEREGDTWIAWHTTSRFLGRITLTQFHTMLEAAQAIEEKKQWSK